jgi:hypothetical protein
VTPYALARGLAAGLAGALAAEAPLGCGIPEEAAAVQLLVRLASPQGAGRLKLWPFDGEEPPTALLEYGQRLAPAVHTGTATVPLCAVAPCPAGPPGPARDMLTTGVTLAAPGRLFLDGQVAVTLVNASAQMRVEVRQGATVVVTLVGPFFFSSVPDPERTLFASGVVGPLAAGSYTLAAVVEAGSCSGAPGNLAGSGAFRRLSHVVLGTG